jgi:uncharacterized protein (TIGR00369 family)
LREWKPSPAYSTFVLSAVSSDTRPSTGWRGKRWGEQERLASVIARSASDEAIQLSIIAVACHCRAWPGKISFIKGMTEDTGPVRSEGRTPNVGRRAATAEARITDAKGRLLAHATTTCLVFEIPQPTTSGT